MIKNKMSVKKDKKIKIKSKIKKFDYKYVYNLITKRFHIKLLCLSMAFILFLYVRYQQEFSKDYIAKLQILNVPSKLLIANNINENITITVRGFRDSKHEYPMEFSTYIDLTNAQLGSNMYKVNLSEEIDYKNMNIIITPNRIPIVLDELVYKTVPVNVVTIGTAALGLNIDDIIVNPSNVIISGPKALISSINKINTIPLDLTDRHLDYSTRLKLNMPKNIKSDTSLVDINVIFNKDMEKIEFNDIVVNINNLDSRFNIKLDSPLIVQKLVLEVNKNLITNISQRDLFLYLNLKNITNAGVYSNMSVEVNIPTYAKLLNIEPSFFDIETESR